MVKMCIISTVAASLRTFLLKAAEALYRTGEFEIYFMASPNKEIEEEFPEYIHFIPIPMKRGVDTKALSIIKQMEDVFKREGFDIVQYFTPNASCYASIAAKRAKIPVRVYSQWGILYVGFKGIKRQIYKQIEIMVCKNSTQIEVENRANLEFSHSEKLYPNTKGTVIWNGSASGVPLGKFDIKKKDEWREKTRKILGISQDDFVFGFCGRQNKDKGLNELFEAMKHILCDYPNAHLILMGSSNDSKTLDQELYNWAKNCENVHFVGRVSNPEEYYAAMDCYTMPSYREGFGMTIIEASSMSVPVIVSDIVGHRDTMIPEKTGLYVESHNSKELFKAMIAMMNNEDMREEMGTQGRIYVENNYDQEELFKKIIEIRKKQAGI